MTESPTQPFVPSADEAAQLEALVNQYLDAYEQHKAWEETKKNIAAQLIDLHAEGKLAGKFPIRTYNFSISSRSTYTYSTETRRLMAQLDAAKEFDKEEGIAVAVPGDPFITLTAIKEPKPKRGR